MPVIVHYPSAFDYLLLDPRATLSPRPKSYAVTNDIKILNASPTRQLWIEFYASLHDPNG